MTVSPHRSGPLQVCATTGRVHSSCGSGLRPRQNRLSGVRFVVRCRSRTVGASRPNGFSRDGRGYCVGVGKTRLLPGEQAIRETFHGSAQLGKVSGVSIIRVVTTSPETTKVMVI